MSVLLSCLESRVVKPKEGVSTSGAGAVEDRDPLRKALGTDRTSAVCRGSNAVSGRAICSVPYILPCGSQAPTQLFRLRVRHPLSNLASPKFL